ncbi:hypothetical protein TWF281_011916 [Arthrobotrys megalospora]
MCIQVLLEKQKKKTYTVKEEERPRPAAAVASGLDNVYYDSSTGRYYSKYDGPNGVRFQAMREIPPPPQHIIYEKKKSRHKCKCRHADPAPASPCHCCRHREPGCQRRVRLIEPTQDDEYLIDEAIPDIKKFVQVDLKTMEKPPGRGYATKELAVKAAYKQGLVLTDPKQTIQMLPGKVGGFFVVGVTDP